jgi:hypothetical protein
MLVTRRTNMKKGLPIVFGAIVGGVLGILVLPIGFISGRGTAWSLPWHDLNMYLIAWEYYVHDQWRFPLMTIPAMGYPEGGSVLFNDALPIGQLVSKIIHSVSGHAINPFGWWILASYVFQGVMAVRVVRAAGVRSVSAAISAAVIATAFTPFMARVWHVAVSSHFLVLWALAVYLDITRRRRLPVAELLALSVLSILVNPYLVVMVMLLLAAAVITLSKERALGRREWIQLLVVMLATTAVAGILGYGALLFGVHSLEGEGFGYFSWNPITLIAPPPLLWGHPSNTFRWGTAGQYEGESYIGVGALLIVMGCFVFLRARVASAMRRHWPLVIVLIGFGVFAASNEVYIGRFHVLHIPLSPAILRAAGTFRASGRFIWVPAYALSLFSLAALFKWGRRALVVPIVLIAVVLQLYEVRELGRGVRKTYGSAAPKLVNTDQVRLWMLSHARVFEFPSWGCGGLEASPEDPAVNSLIQLQINLTAARIGLATNTVYTSRLVKDCTAESQWSEKPEMDDGTLYLLNKRRIYTTPQLAALGNSPQCIDAGWGLVCSRQHLMSSIANSTGQQ